MQESFELVDSALIAGLEHCTDAATRACRMPAATGTDSRWCANFGRTTFRSRMQPARGTCNDGPRVYMLEVWGLVHQPVNF